MEKLNTKQQAEVSKMSTERLRTKLTDAGYDEGHIADLDRNDLLNLYAEYLVAPPVVTVPELGAVGGQVGGMSAEELSLRQKELELRQKELLLREQELERQRQKDEEEKKRRESLAGQTRFLVMR